MSFEVRRGDLFSANLPALAHGCNCSGVMGKGIAVDFRRRWPAMFEEYRALCSAGQFAPGDVMVWETPEGRAIFNLATQRTWRSKATVEAIETSVTRMLHTCESKRIRCVGIPRLGAGLGGLDWEVVASSLRRIASPSSVGLIAFDGSVAAEQPSAKPPERRASE